MKKFFSIILAVLVMAGISAITSSCNKNSNNTDYYQFNWGCHENSKCDFEAINSLYESKYHKWRGEGRSMSHAQAKAQWAEAEAEFKSVESRLHADTGCFYEIKMERYSIVGDAYTPVETIGTWRFPRN